MIRVPDVAEEIRLDVLQIFSLPPLIWLMIYQHLEPKATLSTAVRQVVQQRPRSLLPDHKRIREGTVSGHTGAYGDARQAMPLVVAEKVADRLPKPSDAVPPPRPGRLGPARVHTGRLDGGSAPHPGVSLNPEVAPPAQHLSFLPSICCAVEIQLRRSWISSA
jgi:hypothetical protein